MKKNQLESVGRRLTKAERTIYRMYGDECMSDKEVAYELRKSINTVRNQKRSVIRKKGAKGVTELVKIFQKEKYEARVIQMYPTNPPTDQGAKVISFNTFIQYKAAA